MHGLLEDTTHIDMSIRNLEIIFESAFDDEDAVSKKVQKWANETTTSTIGKAKIKIRNIIAKVKNLFGIATFERGANTQILVDQQAFNKLAAFVARSKTFKVANFTPGNVAAYAKSNVVTDFFGKDNRNASRLNRLYIAMKREINSDKAKKIALATKEFAEVRVTDEIQFKSKVVPFIRNLLVASKKFNQLLEKMSKSISRLVSHSATILRKTRMYKTTRYVRDKKSNLAGRCITYVAYASKLMSNVCLKAINTIDGIINSYYNTFGPKF